MGSLSENICFDYLNKLTLNIIRIANKTPKHRIMNIKLVGILPFMLLSLFLGSCQPTEYDEAAANSLAQKYDTKKAPDVSTTDLAQMIDIYAAGIRHAADDTYDMVSNATTERQVDKVEKQIKQKYQAVVTLGKILKRELKKRPFADVRLDIIEDAHKYFGEKVDRAEEVAESKFGLGDLFQFKVENLTPLKTTN